MPVDFVELDKSGGGVARCLHRHDAANVESLTVSAMFEGHGDGGAGSEGGQVGERALVDGEAVVVVEVDVDGVGHVVGADVGSESESNGGLRVGRDGRVADGGEAVDLLVEGGDRLVDVERREGPKRPAGIKPAGIKPSLKSF